MGERMVGGNVGTEIQAWLHTLGEVTVTQVEDSL